MSGTPASSTALRSANETAELTTQARSYSTPRSGLWRRCSMPGADDDVRTATRSGSTGQLSCSAIGSSPPLGQHHFVHSEDAEDLLRLDATHHGVGVGDHEVAGDEDVRRGI